MKKILLGVSVLALAAIVAVNATGAWFTDKETSKTNTITAGTLELDINENGNGETFVTGLGNFTFNPGEESREATVSIRNGGTVDLAWYGYFNISNDGHEDNLERWLNSVYIKDARMEFRRKGGNTYWLPTDQFITNGRGSGNYPSSYENMANNSPHKVITLKEWNNAAPMGFGNGVQGGGLKADKKEKYEYRFTFTLAMVEDTPNELQGQSLNLSYTVEATQINKNALDALNNPGGRINILDTAYQANTWLPAQIAVQNY